jgi:hypothetical protein
LWDVFSNFIRAASLKRVQGVVLASLLVMSGCAVRRTTVVPPSERPKPAFSASVADLLKDIDEWSGNIRTLEAVVDFQPTAGSVYSGVIKEYHDVRGYILLKAPVTIRIQGQAPVVKTMIFDMVSDGREFRLSIPPKNQFIIGKTSVHAPAKNSLENVRPQHILDALLIPPVDPAQDHYFVERSEERSHSYYVLGLLQPAQGGEMNLLRKFWFDRSDLKLARLEIFGPGGAMLEDVHYSDYKEFGAVSYPAEIHLRRLPEDYSLGITIEKATFNLEIPPQKFILQKPPNAEVIELDKDEPAEAPDGR